MTIQSMTYGKMSKILDQAVFGEMGNFLPTLGEAVGRCLPLFANPHRNPMQTMENTYISIPKIQA